MTGCRAARHDRICSLLRAVNVGGTGKLPMAELAGMCQRAGFRDVRTYIASGNAVFSFTPARPLHGARLYAQPQHCGQAVGDGCCIALTPGPALAQSVLHWPGTGFGSRWPSHPLGDALASSATARKEGTLSSNLSRTIPRLLPVR